MSAASQMRAGPADAQRPLHVGEPGPPAFGLTRVLIVSSDPGRGRAWIEALERHGVDARAESTLPHALDHLASRPVDVVLADADLPEGGALDLARRFYRSSPAILILGRDDLVDRLVAVEMGADDLLSSEIDVRELVARLRTLVRPTRFAERAIRTAVWRARPTLRALEAPNGRVAALSARHWKLVELMAEGEGRPLDAARAAAAIPSFRENPEGALRTAVSRLRRRLVEQTGVDLIENYYGAGYVLTAPVIFSANDR